MSSLPLLALFERLRAVGFPIGLPEYFEVLHAMRDGLAERAEQGVPIESRDELLFLCQSLWASSLEEQGRLSALFDDTMPPRFTEDHLEALVAAHEAVRTTDGADAHDVRRDKPERADGVPHPPDRAPSGPLDGTAEIERQADAMSPGDVLSAFRDARDGRGLPSPVGLQLAEVLPVSRRQMIRAWRHFRRPGRSGPRTEFDVAATLQQLHRSGVLVGPVLVPRTTNQAHALVLEDVGGSMVPFRYLSAALLDTLRHSGLASVAVYYFHDVPTGGTVYRDTACLEPVSLRDIAASLAGAGVLIYSDAGAARGRRESERARQTAELLDALSRSTRAIAWLNPVPESRWQNTTAALLTALALPVAMFPVTRRGLESAVRVMRGLAR